MRSKILLSLIALLLLIPGWAYPQKKTGSAGSGQKKPATTSQQQKKPPQKFTKEQIESFREQSTQLVRFFEGTLNFLADKRNPVKEKQVIVNQSYLKTFWDEKVQVEDDLDEKRLVPLYKDIPAYLRDVDFFFKRAKFQYSVQDVSAMENEQGQTYFKVTANRNLNGLTVNGDSVNSNKVLYFEINYDDSKQQLKIVSIYTTKLNEKDDMRNWWNGLTDSWRGVLGKNRTADGVLFLSSITSFHDSVAVVNGERIRVDGPAVYNLLAQLVNSTEIDLSGNDSVTDIGPLSKLSSLRNVNLSGTGVTDLMPLRNLNALEVLDISGTQVSSLEALRYSNNLRVLKINHTPLSDIGLFTAFPLLEILDFSHTSVSGLVPVKDLAALNELRFAYTPVSDLSPLSGLAALEILDFSGTQVLNTGVLKNLGQLRMVCFDDTRVNTLASFGALGEIRKIYCDKTPISKEQAISFMQDHPGVTVIFESEELLAWWKGMSNDWKKVFALYAPLDNPPTTEQLHRLVTIDSLILNGRAGIGTLQPAERLPYLRHLELTGTSVTELDPLHDLSGLEVINAANSRITGIAPLAGLKKLKVLAVDNTGVNDLSPLDGLPELEIVYADNTGVTLDEANRFLDRNPQVMVVFQTYENTGWWKGLPEPWRTGFLKQTGLTGNPGKIELQEIANLETLVISNDPQITSLQPVTRLSRLKELDISDTRVSDLQPLIKMKRLTVLRFPKNPVADLTPLSAMSNLKEIDLSNTPVEDLEPIQNLTGLEVLKFSGTPVKNLKYIEKLTRLKTLEFYNTKISNLEVLENMPDLTSLKIFNTKISSKRVEKYKEMHPRCEVIYY